MTIAAHLTQLQSLLQQEIEASRQLSQILEEEFDALSRKDAAGIELCAANKQRQVELIERLYKQHAALARQAGFENNNTGMGSYIQRHDPHGAYHLAFLWKEFNELIEQCQGQNEVNGKIVILSRNVTQRALAILRGNPAGQQTCYGPQGQATTTPPSVVLAKA